MNQNEPTNYSSAQAIYQATNPLIHPSANQRTHPPTKYMLRAHRTVRNEEGKTSFSLDLSAESFVVSLLLDQLAQPEETVNASY